MRTSIGLDSESFDSGLDGSENRGSNIFGSENFGSEAVRSIGREFNDGTISSGSSFGDVIGRWLAAAGCTIAD
jgi:hypothetical protein